MNKTLVQKAKTIIIRAFTILVLLCALSPFQIVFAASNAYIPLAPIPGTVREGCNFNDPAARCETDFLFYLNGAYKTAIGVAGLLAVVMIIWWGFQYVLTSKEGGKSESKEGITNAIVGLLLTLLSWLIVYTINPKLVELDFKVQKATDYEPINVQDAFEKEMAEYQKMNTELANEQKKIDEKIKNREAELINKDPENPASAEEDPEIKALKIERANTTLKKSLNNSTESVKFHTNINSIAEGSSTLTEHLQMARDALNQMDASYQKVEKTLTENGAADQIPAAKAQYEAKRKELVEIIAHRERCPYGDTNTEAFGESISTTPCN